MANKTIYDLTENQTLDADDLFEQDVLQNNERKSLKVTLRAIADKIISSLTYSSLNTTSKTVVGAINELEEGGGGGGGNANVEHLTQAEYDALPNTKLSDNKIYMIEDAVGGNNLVKYSTTEHVIGSWIDGSPLYEKTWDFGSDLSIASNTWVDTTISVANNSISKIVGVEGMNANGTVLNFLGANPESTYVRLLQTRNSAIGIRYLTLRYIKTS